MAEEKAPAKAKKTEVEKASEEKKKKSGVWKFAKRVLLGFVLFFVVVAGLAFFFTRGASSAGNDIIANITDGECSTVYEITSDAFRENTDEATWTSFCEQVSSVLQDSNVDQTGVSVESATGEQSVADISYRIEATDATYEITMQLVDQDGWKLETMSAKVADEQGATGTQEVTE